MKLVSKNLVQESVYELEIRVDGEEFSKAYDKSYAKNSRNISIKGFRKGKTPRSLVMKMVGENYFCDDAIELTYPQAYKDALDAAELEPVAQGDMKEVKDVSPEGYTFVVHVTVRPDVKLGEYKGLKVEKKATEISDKDVDDELASIADRHSRLMEVTDRAAESGDTAILTYKGYLNDVAFDGGSAENYSLVLGSGQFIPGFEDQVIGHSVGENFDIVVTFPEEYPADELKGKEVVFKATLNGLKYKQLPVIDDEFAKDISEHDTLEQLRADIKDKITKRAIITADNEAENRLCEMAAENAEVNVPRAMLDEKITHLVKDFEMRIKYQGIGLEEYLTFSGKTIDDIRSEFEDEAHRQVKTTLVLEQIAMEEKLEPSAEDIEKEYQRLAVEYKIEIDKVRETITEDSVKDSLMIISYNLYKGQCRDYGNCPDQGAC